MSDEDKAVAGTWRFGDPDKNPDLEERAKRLAFFAREIMAAHHEIASERPSTETYGLMLAQARRALLNAAAEIDFAVDYLNIVWSGTNERLEDAIAHVEGLSGSKVSLFDFRLAVPRDELEQATDEPEKAPADEDPKAST